LTNPTFNDFIGIISKSDIDRSYINDVITILLSSKDLTMQKLIQKSRLPKSIVVKILKLLQTFLFNPTEYIRIKDYGIEIFQKYINLVKPSVLTKYDWVQLINQKEKISFLEKILSGRLPPKRSLDQFDASVDTLLRRAKFLEINGSISDSKVLFLGDYDLTSLAVAKTGGAKEIHVIDIDQDLLKFIKQISDNYQFPIFTHLQDLRLGFPEELLSSFDVVFTDPPFTINGARLFLEHAINALTPRGVIYCCFGYSINDLLIGKQFQALLNDLGLVARSVLENFNIYSKAQSIGSTSHLFKLVPIKKGKYRPPQISGMIYTGYKEKEDLIQLVNDSLRFKLIDKDIIKLLLRELLVGRTKTVVFFIPTNGLLQKQLSDRGVFIKAIESDSSDIDPFKNDGKLIIESPLLNLDLIFDWIRLKNCKNIYLFLPVRFQNIDQDSKEVKISFLTRSFLSIFWKWSVISEVPPEAFEPCYSQTTYLYRVTPLLKELLLPNFPKYVIREIFEQSTKKIVNALREGIIRYYQKMGAKFTKKQSIKIVHKLNLPKNILNLEITQLSKDELIVLFKTLFEKLK